jgi:hypothetical protein
MAAQAPCLQGAAGACRVPGLHMQAEGSTAEARHAAALLSPTQGLTHCRNVIVVKGR